MKYSTRRLHNYHELTAGQKVRYWAFDRWSTPTEKRFFFEGCRKIAGEMYVAEREALYTTILRWRPGLCFEVGTASGGGSTFYLASALARIGEGGLGTTPPGSSRTSEATRATRFASSSTDPTTGRRRWSSSRSSNDTWFRPAS